MAFAGVVWYVPNLIGYARLALLAYGMASAATSPARFVCCWLVSCALDFADGWLARRLDQCSRFGELLDVVCDNAARSSMWMAACTTRGPGLLPLCAGVASLEWLCFTATQVSAAMRGAGHWKDVRATDPPALVTAYFANNFVNPVGALGIAGLFGSPLFLYCAAVWPAALGGSVAQGAGALLHVGRALSACIELFFVGDFFRMLALLDARRGAQHEGQTKSS